MGAPDFMTKRITRAAFVKLAEITERDLDKMRDCGVIQQFKTYPGQRKGLYWRCQAEAIRDGKAIPLMEWKNPQKTKSKART
jgi:hypothetical protein